MLQDVVSEASALAAWDIARKYYANDLLVPVTAPNSAEASLTLSPPLGSAPVPSTLKPGVWASQVATYESAWNPPRTFPVEVLVGSESTLASSRLDVA